VAATSCSGDTYGRSTLVRISCTSWAKKQILRVHFSTSLQSAVRYLRVAAHMSHQVVRGGRAAGDASTFRETISPPHTCLTDWFQVFRGWWREKGMVAGRSSSSANPAQVM